MSVRQWRNARQEPSTMRFCLCFLCKLALERESDQHLNAYRPGASNSGNHGRFYQGLCPQDKGKSLRMLAI